MVYVLTFLGGSATVLLLEVIGLNAFLEPFRNVFNALFGAS
jgi:hypothetical protein